MAAFAERFGDGPEVEVLRLLGLFDRPATKGAIEALRAPPPIDDLTEQICLLGRGYSKTVIVCVLSELAQKQERDDIETALRAQVAATNKNVDKHERIGAVIVTTEPWTIANEILTPTLKIRREQVETRFGELAQRLARESAEQGEILLEWKGAS